MIESTMKRFDITTPMRVAGFLAQCAHESKRFSDIEEDLNYRPETLVKTWPNRFPTLESARFYAHAPERLANHTYANRMGNGPEQSGDGYRFRGRAYLQATGRQMYYQLGVRLGRPLMLQPEKLSQDEFVAWEASGCIWRDLKGCNEFMDAGDFDATSRAINLGDAKSKKTPNGQDDRRALYASFTRVLTEGAPQ